MKIELKATDDTTYIGDKVEVTSNIIRLANVERIGQYGYVPVGDHGEIVYFDRSQIIWHYEIEEQLKGLKRLFLYV